MSKKNIVITGGCGFIGTNVANDFLEKGYRVYLIDNLYRLGSAENLKWLKRHGENVIHVNIDIAIQTEIFDFFATISNIEAVFHFAAQVAATTSVDNPVRDFNTNALGTFNICESVRRYCIDALLVYSSTNKVYGDLEAYTVIEDKKRFSLEQYPQGLPISIPLDFHSPYGCSKGAGDQYVRDYHRIFGLKSIVLRLSTIYGGRQFATYDQGWVGWFTQQFVSNSLFTVCGTGKQVRDMLHINDFMSLMGVLLAKKNVVAGEIFNIGGGIGNSFSLLELFDFLEQELSVYPKITHLEKRKGEQDFYVSDLEKINQYGWVPEVSKEDGIRSILEWNRDLLVGSRS